VNYFFDLLILGEMNNKQVIYDTNFKDHFSITEQFNIDKILAISKQGKHIIYLEN